MLLYDDMTLATIVQKLIMIYMIYKTSRTKNVESFKQLLLNILITQNLDVVSINAKKYNKSLRNVYHYSWLFKK